MFTEMPIKLLRTKRTNNLPIYFQQIKIRHGELAVRAHRAHRELQCKTLEEEYGKQKVAVRRIMSTTNPKTTKFSMKFNKKAVKKTDQATQNTSKEQSTSDDVLTRMAIEEIVKETAKGAIRAEQVGPSGWVPCPLLKTNKRFLRNTIKSVISHNRNKTYKPKKSEDELNEIIKRGQKRKPKFGDRVHCFRRPNVGRGKESDAKSESK